MTSWICEHCGHVNHVQLSPRHEEIMSLVGDIYRMTRQPVRVTMLADRMGYAAVTIRNEVRALVEQGVLYRDPDHPKRGVMLLVQTQERHLRLAA